ncbi:MAG: DUF2085 domain-containing protein [Candidatus Bathyarchaeota archaeon]|nr:DUF2085 domain-containing protein [Candidatus Bathyarchaeota archaeon]
MELWRLLAHRNWFTLRAFGLELRLCSRCSGYLAGFLFLTVSRSVIGLQAFQALPTQNQFIICMLFSMPLILDWLTQSWGLREGDNITRFITGAILGMGISLYYVTEFSPDLKAPLFVLTALAVALIGFIGLKAKEI